MNPALWGFVCALSWGSSEFVARVSGRAIGPTNSLLGMFLVGAVGISLWVWLTGAPLVWATEGIVWLVATGVLFMVAFLLFYTALSRGPVSIAAPVVASYPAFVLVGTLAMGIYPTGIQWAAIAAIMAGVGIVARTGHGAAGAEPEALGGIALTIALSVGAAALFGMWILVAREAVAIYGGLQTLWLTRLVSLAILVLVLMARRRAPVIPLRWWPALIFQGVFDALGVFAILTGTAGEGAAVATVASAPVAVVTVLLAWIFLRERIPASQWGGISLVVASGAVLAYVG